MTQQIISERKPQANHVTDSATEEQQQKAQKGSNQYLPDIPALRQPEITSTDRDLGPRVPTILVRAGKKLCDIIHHAKSKTSKMIAEATTSNG